MDDLRSLLYIAAGYLAGAVPFGLLFSRILGGVDVRTVGSGNIGATNVLRAAGTSAAVLTLLADGLKGALPVLLASRAGGGGWIPVLTGIASVLGHTYPVFLGFRGGKGVATSFGVALAVTPWLGLAGLLVWLGAAAAWRISSLSALVAFASYPVMVIALKGDDRAVGTLALFLFGMIYYRHRENIQRIRAGTEPKIGQKR